MYDLGKYYRTALRARSLPGATHLLWKNLHMDASKSNFLVLEHHITGGLTQEESVF